MVYRWFASLPEWYLRDERSPFVGETLDKATTQKNKHTFELKIIFHNQVENTVLDTYIPLLKLTLHFLNM